MTQDPSPPSSLHVPVDRSLRDDLAKALGESDRLRAQLDQMMSTNGELSTLLLRANRRGGELLKLLVSVRALIESHDATAALEGLADILLTIIGSEDFSIYAIDPDDGFLVPIAGSGTVFGAASRHSMQSSWLGRVVGAGDVVITAGDSEATGVSESEPMAVVPLKVQNRVLGAIVIEQVLRHRKRLDHCDREVLGLLGGYAATAIIAAECRSEWHALPRTSR